MTDFLHPPQDDPQGLALPATEPSKSTTFYTGPDNAVLNDHPRVLQLCAAELADLAGAISWLLLSSDTAGKAAKLGGINVGIQRVLQRLHSPRPPEA